MVLPSGSTSKAATADNAAVSAAESANQSTGFIAGIPRWLLFYLLLGAMNVMTICASVLLSHALVSIHTESLELQGALARLRRLAVAANAPGNDVFASRDVRQAESRLDAALIAFADGMAEVRRRLPNYPEETDAIDRAMALQVGEAREVLRLLTESRTEEAGGHMASMDRGGVAVDTAISVLD